MLGTFPPIWRRSFFEIFGDFLEVLAYTAGVPEEFSEKFSGFFEIFEIFEFLVISLSP